MSTFSVNAEAIQAATTHSQCIVVWIDFMKFGVLSKEELNYTMNIMSKVLSALPESSVGFVIAPSCTSDRRSGLRDELRWGVHWPRAHQRKVLKIKFAKSSQIKLINFCNWVHSSMNNWRRVEDKMDAKHLDFEAIFLRCQDPPSTKKVPLTFPAWLVFPSQCATNKFAGCQLLQDKCLVSQYCFMIIWCFHIENRLNGKN